jgi:hypothetical protein
MGGDTHITEPNPPPAPTTAQSMAEWVQNYPAVFNLQQQYAPQEAAQQVALTQQYAAPMGQAFKTAQDQMYPNETALSNQLTQTATEGMQSQVPDWQRAQYQSDLNANLGTNVGSGIGADYVSRGLLQQQQDWNKYYQNMGMSIAGKQPVYGAQQPQTSNYASQFTPNAVMGSNAQNYGSFAGLYGNMYGANASQMYQGGVNLGILGRWGGR